MKEVLIFFSICLISASVHENGATKLGHKSVRHRKLFNERWTRDNLVRKEKGKRLKLNSSDKKENASYMKRQFVPEMPAFFNFPHPHIHRIIVHHHPGKWVKKVRCLCISLFVCYFKRKIDVRMR